MAEIAEIQYQPESPNVGFNPVTPVDATPLMERNNQQQIEEMNQRLAQMKENAAVRLSNVKNAHTPFPAEQLAQFSNTLSGLLQNKIDQDREDIEAEMTMLAFTDGIAADPAFDAAEAQLQRDGEAITGQADAYEMQTGDIEGAERVRNLSGWKKYYYAKAKVDQAGQGFGAWMTANAANPDYAVNVGGQEYTLQSAPDGATRQAVAAKMASTYMRPYQGMNKSFLGKYMFPGMQRGMRSSVAAAAADHARLMKANRLDSAVTTFRDNPTPEGMYELDRTLRLSGYDNKTIRGYIVGEMQKVQSDAEFERLMATPYGPNGKPFQEQYPQEAAQLRVDRESGQALSVQAAEMNRNTADREALEQARQAVDKDVADGSFDANPERLKELADAARLAGNTRTAEYWESQIGETAYMKSSDQIKQQYEAQIMAGVVPTEDEITMNRALSQEDKQALLKQVESAGGSSEPATEQQKSHKKQIEDAVKQRGSWTKDGANHPSIEGMSFKAWQEYRQVYANEYQKTGSHQAAAKAAIADFYGKFGTDASKGEYAVGGVGAGAGKRGVYVNYDMTGTPSDAQSGLAQYQQKLQYANANTVINTYPDLFDGEEAALQRMTIEYENNNRLGEIPPAYYDIQQQMGGGVSMVQLINARLKANGLAPLPKEVTSVITPIEGAFDESTYRYISYKPNTTRTDIGMISMGQQAVYQAASPAQRLALDTIAKTESGSSGYDAVNQGGEDGGKKVLGYSGRYSQMPTRRYDLPLTQMTIGQILQEGDPRFGSLTTSQFQAAGGIHAAGRYQIIHNTLKGLVRRHNIPMDTVFSEEVQDFLALSLLNSGGDGQWVGPTDADRVIIRRGRTQGLPLPPWRQPANMRPGL